MLTKANFDITFLVLGSCLTLDNFSTDNWKKKTHYSSASSRVEFHSLNFIFPTDLSIRKNWCGDDLKAYHLSDCFHYL
jgi:hypothetical protein